MFTTGYLSRSDHQPRKSSVTLDWIPSRRQKKSTLHLLCLPFGIFTFTRCCWVGVGCCTCIWITAASVRVAASLSFWQCTFAGRGTLPWLLFVFLFFVLTFFRIRRVCLLFERFLVLLLLGLFLLRLVFSVSTPPTSGSDSPDSSQVVTFSFALSSASCCILLNGNF